MKKTGRQSSNIEDRRLAPLDESGMIPARDAVNETLRNMYTNAGTVSVKQRQNAKALGLGKSLEDLTNQANKVQARKRTRFTTGTDREVIKSLTKRTK